MAPVRMPAGLALRYLDAEALTAFLPVTRSSPHLARLYAVTFALVDGSRTVEEIAEVVRRHPAVVRATLSDLAHAGLIELPGGRTW